MQSCTDDAAIAAEKVGYIRSALRSTTIAYLLAPNLCIPLFLGDVEPILFWTWYALAMAFGAFRIAVSFGPDWRLPPRRALQLLTAAVAGVGLVWGAGWILLVPELSSENRYIFLYIVTGTMFSAMFGYGVHRPAFLAVAVPTLAPAPLALFWPNSSFPLPFSIGILGLMITVYGISRRFEYTFVETLRLRFENQRIAEQLAQERDSSVAANIAKSEFIATASHDLRQPMFAINLQLRSLDGLDLPVTVRRTLDVIRTSVTKLNAMFSELLDISRADAGVIEPALQPLDLAQALSEVCVTTRVQCEAKGLTFASNIAGLSVESDPILLAQIVQNLLTNAVQNTSAGRISLTAEEHDGRVMLAVRDTGRGIPAAHRERMFDEFFRVPREDEQNEAAGMQGLGLGLSIVRRLTRLLGIAIAVESEVGKGTVFRLSLPATETKFSMGSVPLPSSMHDLKGATILVVDDDPLVRAGYAAALGSEGVMVFQSDGIDLAAGRYPDRKPDLVIADFKLGPIIRGHQVIEGLRAHFGEAIPAIIITADTAPELLNLLRQIGVPVLFKPVSYSRLRQSIDGLMKAACSATADEM